MILHSHNAEAAGVIIGLDRKERGNGDQSTIQESRERFSNSGSEHYRYVKDIMQYLSNETGSDDLIDQINATESNTVSESLHNSNSGN